jgi:hypothetical protein
VSHCSILLQDAVGSRTLGVHHPTEAACLPTSASHCMQILESFEPPKFRSEGRRRMRPWSRSGPCPLRPHLHGWEPRSTRSPQHTSLAQHEHAMIPTEDPPNTFAREGVTSIRYLTPTCALFETTNLAQGLERQSAATERLGAPRHNPV